MAEILLCGQSIKSESLNQCGINSESIVGMGCTNPVTLNAHRPYLVGKTPTGADIALLNRLSPAQTSKELTNLSLSLGADNTLAMADITAKLQEYNIGLIGATTSVYANRIQGFGGAVKNYQAALMDYRQALKSGPAAKLLAKQKAHAAFQKMQIGFRHELTAVTLQSRARKGTPLTSITRATNIANSSRNVVKLDVTSQVQANNLVKFSQQAKFLGNGLAVIDFGSRIGNIHNSYQAGEKWERELFIESSSFAAGAGAGILAVNAGGAALTFLMVATPIGWVGLIVGGIAVAGVAAATSIGVNNYAKENSGRLYDNIMKRISGL